MARADDRTWVKGHHNSYEMYGYNTVPWRQATFPGLSGLWAGPFYSTHSGMNVHRAACTCVYE
jgi:hypothetical protein